MYPNSEWDSNPRSQCYASEDTWPLQSVSIISS